MWGSNRPRLERRQAGTRLALKRRNLRFQLCNAMSVDLALVDQLLQLSIERVQPLLQLNRRGLARGKLLLKYGDLRGIINSLDYIKNSGKFPTAATWASAMAR